MFTVFRMLLMVVHFLYDLFSAIHNRCLILHRKCTEILCGENLRTELITLGRIALKAKNLPSHIVIVFGPKKDPILDSVRIIGWCITLGIPYISFFDTNGFLTKNENFLKSEVAKRKPSLMEHIIWGKSHVKAARNGINGCKSKIRVSLLSYVDGKGEIVALTQELAKAVAAGVIKSEEINDDLLSEKLKLQGCPDPELAIIYGNVCSTYGLLPWHTRTTEFFTFPVYYNMLVQDFAYFLEKYCKCEQRFGK